MTSGVGKHGWVLREQLSILLSLKVSDDKVQHSSE
jgi:hypothetical protein